jgi:hypothetical protein
MPKVSDFEVSKMLKDQNKIRTPGFGGSSSRFDYAPKRRKQGNEPSSFSYNSCDMATNKGSRFESNVSKTFGMGTRDMKKLFIAEIE